MIFKSMVTRFNAHQWIVALALVLGGCTTTRKRIVVTNCVNDPLTKTFQCVDRFGKDLVISWESESAANLVCRPPEDDRLIMQELYKD